MPQSRILQKNVGLSGDELFCPMIDARRMEVFAGIYDKNLEVILEPNAIEISNTSFNDLLKDKQVYFFGSGSRSVNQY